MTGNVADRRQFAVDFVEYKIIFELKVDVKMQYLKNNKVKRAVLCVISILKEGSIAHLSRNSSSHYKNPIISQPN